MSSFEHRLRTDLPDPDIQRYVSQLLVPSAFTTIQITDEKGASVREVITPKPSEIRGIASIAIITPTYENPEFGIIPFPPSECNPSNFMDGIIQTLRQLKRQSPIHIPIGSFTTIARQQGLESLGGVAALGGHGRYTAALFIPTALETYLTDIYEYTPFPVSLDTFDPQAEAVALTARNLEYLFTQGQLEQGR